MGHSRTPLASRATAGRGRLGPRPWTFLTASCVSLTPRAGCKHWAQGRQRPLISAGILTAGSHTSPALAGAQPAPQKTPGAPPASRGGVPALPAGSRPGLAPVCPVSPLCMGQVGVRMGSNSGYVPYATSPATAVRTWPGTLAPLCRSPSLWIGVCVFACGPLPQQNT